MSFSKKQFSDETGRIFHFFISISEKSKRPSMIILSEDLGISDWILNTAKKFTEFGCTVIIPDISLYKVTGNKTRQLNNPSIKNLDLNRAVQDLKQIIKYAKTNFILNKNLGIIGFFYGATLAYLVSSRLNPNFAIAYFGIGIDSHLSEGKYIKCPLIMHGLDCKDIQKVEAKNKIEAALIGKENISIFYYKCDEEADHTDIKLLISMDIMNKAHEKSIKLIEKLE